MTKKEITDKLASIERDVKEIREYLSHNESMSVTPVENPLTIEKNFELRYTLEDLYREFGNKKLLAHRLKTALQKRNIKTLEEFLTLTPGELLDLENVGYDTLLRTKKALSRLGLVW